MPQCEITPLSSLEWMDARTMNNLIFSKLQRGVNAALLGLAAVAVSGCATMSAPERTVEQRATEYWHARLDGRPDKTYELTTPAHRQLRTLQQYRVKATGLAAKSAEVVGVKCEPERCVVRIKLAVQPGIATVKLDSVEMYMDDVWVLEDGQWWHYEAL